MNHHRLTGARGIVAVTLASVFLLAIGGPSASARPDPGSERVAAQDGSIRHCPLLRVGTEFVRCDDQTGNGVAAPSWVPTS